MICANCNGSHYVTSFDCSARKQTVRLTQSGKDELPMLKLESQQRMEECEAAGKAKETERRVEEEAMVITTRERRSKKERPIIRNGEDGDLSMQNDCEGMETQVQGVKTSMHISTSRKSTTSPLNGSRVT